MAERPGILVYFDKWEPMLKMPNEHVGELFRAALLYGKYGTLPEFSGMTEVLWDMVKSEVDRDGKRYDETSEARKYAVYCREVKKTGGVALDMNAWKEQVLSNDSIRYPTTTTTPTATPTTATTPNPTATVNPTTATTADTNTTRGSAEGEQDPAFEAKRLAAMRMIDNYGEG